MALNTSVEVEDSKIELQQDMRRATQVVHKKDVSSLTSLIELHRVLEKHCLVRDDDLARKRFAEHRKCLLPIRYVFLVVYIVFIPFWECPNWCLDKK